ncbi:hypothetical protein CLU90_1004 [Janthinobacterium sp. 67]|uniref:hypothetical protein n=1 Tax=Janthinobacterium sp. 67 TaxID=2035207 RepID=UPI000CA897A8|nr:hypothetical protein [Janthinobacterium sp. 67]PJJ17824.1 hypothetical protein CLU90_1004 [Janthinobacterium sp. 67]
MNRLKEPSTWAGFAALFQLAKLIVPTQYHIVVDGATAMAGALAGVIAEKGPVAK